MGFFSKLWKGVKKVFKKVGKAIKKAVRGVGRGLGTVLNTAHKFATTAGNVFGTVTEGVSQFAKTALNKIPGVNIEGAATSFFGNDSAWSRTIDKASTVFDPFKDTPATPAAAPEPSFDASSEYQQQMKQDLDYLSETPLSEQTGPSMEGRGPLLPPEQQPSVAAVPEPSSLLSTAGTTLRKSFESDPLAVTQRVFDLAGQAQALTQSPGDVFYGGGAQTQYLFEPAIGMQTPAAPQVDISQGPYGYNAFAQAYDFSQMSPWEYYMQQQKRYA
jgi:hypothetical protein